MHDFSFYTASNFLSNVPLHPTESIKILNCSTFIFKISNCSTFIFKILNCSADNFLSEYWWAVCLLLFIKIIFSLFLYLYLMFIFLCLYFVFLLFVKLWHFYTSWEMLRIKLWLQCAGFFCLEEFLYSPNSVMKFRIYIRFRIAISVPC